MNHFRTFMLLAALTALFGGIGYLIGGVGGMAIALAVAVAMNLFAYWNADKMVLRHFHAQPAENSRDPRVQAYMEDTLDMAQRAGLPAPKVYIIENPQPNAFATGRDPAHAAVAATTGLLSVLTRDEIRGVMAHELAHVQNRDTLIMTVTAAIAGAIGLIANFAMFFGNNRNNIVAGLAIMILAPLAAALVQMAISRAREYEADRVGAKIGGDPTALARALEKIETYARGGAINEDAERNPAMAHLFIINPLSGHGADNLFSTHPSTRNRITQLMEQARRLGLAPRAAAPQTGSPGPWGSRPSRLQTPPKPGPWG